MKHCTVKVVTAPTGVRHFAVATVDKDRSLALCGSTSSKKSEAEAKFFADAPLMFEVLECLSREYSNVNMAFPLSHGRIAELMFLTERAKNLVEKHQSLEFL